MPDNFTPSISQFLSSLEVDLARPSRFDLFITLPNAVYNDVGVPASRLRVRCESGALPGRTFGTADQKIYGPAEKHPVLSSYEPLSFTFICSDDMSEKKVFDSWMNLINPNQDTFNGTKWNMAYRSDFVTDVYINQYSLTGDITEKVQLIDAFPVSTNSMELDWGSTSIHKITVTFAYTNWQSI